MNLDQEQKEWSISLVELIGLVKRYLSMMLIMGIIAGGITFFWCSCCVDPVYKASAKMIVNSKADQSGTVTNDQITSSQKLVDTYAIIIRSQTVLNPVIETLELDVGYETLQKMVTVSSVDQTQVMEIAVECKDPVLAVKIVEEILKISPDIIIDAMEAGSVKTVEKAYLQSKPVSPNTNLNTVVVTFLSMFLVAAVVVIRFMMDNTYKSDVDLRHDLGLPVLGIIPEYDSCQKRTNRA